MKVNIRKPPKDSNKQQRIDVTIEEHEINPCFEYKTDVNGISGLVIPTLEGDMYASVGDYIIRGLIGEYYPCKPDVFHKKYELNNSKEL